MHYKAIDIFCHVVDNFGDIGFVCRFAREFLSANPQCRVRVFVDDLNVLNAVNPVIDPAVSVQTHDAIEYIAYDALTADFVENLDIADVLVESFACHIPELIMKAAESRFRVIINLEHLTAEDWVEGYHLRPSVLPSETLKKYFYMPGFTPATGGMIIDHSILRDRLRLFETRFSFLKELFAETGHAVDGLEKALMGTVFTYERGFDTMMAELEDLRKPVVLLVFGDKSRRGMINTLERIGGRQIRENYHHSGNVRIVFMPFIAQPRYDALLCRADFNIVRGEDSLVRAILAGRPFIWNAYLQDNKYQKVKVEAFAARIEEFFKGEEEAFSHYRSLLLLFNDAASESSDQVTAEQYHYFLRNLTKFMHATEEMSYFLARNCDLVKQFSAFLRSL